MAARSYTATFTIVLRPKVPLGLSMLQCRFAATKGGRGRKWTTEDVAQLRKLVTERRSDSEMHRFFPDRTFCGLNARAKRLRRELGVLGPRYWSDEEVAIVKQTKASGISARDTFGLLPNRSLQAKQYILANRRYNDRRLNSGKPFTAEDFNNIRRLREESQLSFTEIADRLERTPHSIRVFYNRHRDIPKVRKASGTTPWTDADTDTLRHLILDGLTDSEIAKQMKRLRSMILGRKQELYHREPKLMRLPQWTAEEDKVLEDAFKSGLQAEQIQARMLPRRTVRAIGSRLLQKRRANGTGTPIIARRNWSPEEDKMLRDDLASGLEPKRIQAESFPHRTLVAVNSRIATLKRRGRVHSKTTSTLLSKDIDDKNIVR